MKYNKDVKRKNIKPFLKKEGILKLSNFNLGPGLFILAYHLFLLIGLPLYFMHHTPSWGLILTSSVLMYVTGLCVTAGYHRHYSHTTYKLHPIAESIMLFFSTMATQGSALRWSFDHRHHHAFVDTDRDPYSIKKGFWYAHFLWLFEKPKPIEPKVVSDLLRNPLVVFQHKYYGLLMFATNAIAFLLVGYFFNDYLGAFFFAWLVRMFFLHHFTWFVNSLAHTWGARTFCQELSAVDNYLIALLTFGEGYHNYHHTFANDYRNGIRWFHFDPTKWMIWTLSKLGLAKNLKKLHRYFLEERLLNDRKEVLLERISDSEVPEKEVWEEKIHTFSETLRVKIKELKQISEHYLHAKKEGSKESIHHIQAQIKDARKGLKKEFKEWMRLSKNIKKIAPVFNRERGHAHTSSPLEDYNV